MKPNTEPATLAHVAKTRERHRKVIKSVLSENLRKDGKRVSRKQAMKDVGYSDSYASSSQITKTKSYPKLLEEVIPSSELAREHRVLLYDKEIESYLFPKSYSDQKITEIIEGFGFPVMRIEMQQNGKRAFFSIINAKAKKDALDMAYKIKKLYINGTHVEITNPFAELSDEQLHRRGIEVYARIGKRLRGIRGDRGRGAKASRGAPGA